MTAKGLTAPIVAFALVLMAPSGVASAEAQGSPGSGTTPPPSGTSTTTTPQSEQTPVKPVKPVKPATRTRLEHVPGSRIADGSAPLDVRLSSAPAPGSPAPWLHPSVAGTWKTAGDVESFVPKSTLEPCSTYTLTIRPATTATGHLPLGKRRRIRLHVACPSIRGLQQALARLGYLPYTLHSHGRLNARRGRESRSLAARYAYHPPAGPLRRNLPHAPGLWYGALDPTTRGALMVFQSSHGLAADGNPGRSTWAALLTAETRGRGDRTPYTFVTVSESIPETLEVHRGRRVVLTSPTNTGVPGAVTEQGTFPIYARYVSTTMSGTNPNGTKYNDPGVPWVNYFNGGDAVHGFPRPSYGSPQSNGCVELPIPTSERVFRLLSIGDLVVVTG